MNKTVGLVTMEKMDNRTFGSVGSSRIRMRWLLPFWEEAEEYGIAKKYDVLIFQKVYWETFKEYGDTYKGIKIFDLCDPDWLENKPVFEYIDWSHAVTTSTQALADYIQKLRPNALVRCIPDRVYIPESVPIKTEHADKITNLVWFGYSHNAHYLTRVFDELIRRGIQLTVISDNPIEAPMAYRGRINIHNVMYNYDSLNKEMVKCDAVLMPEPTGDERAKYKSNNKTLHAWSIGMPVIKVPEDIDRLATKEAREQETAKQLQEIKDKWDVRYSVDEYKALIEEIKTKL